jgi:hypothetical protein
MISIDRERATLDLALGLLGGTDFILCSRLLRPFHATLGVTESTFLLYGTFIAVTGFFLWRERVETTSQRFVIGLVTYSIAIIIQFTFLVLTKHTFTVRPALGVFWRVTGAIVIGLPFLWIMARLSGRKSGDLILKL